MKKIKRAVLEKIKRDVHGFKLPDGVDPKDQDMVLAHGFMQVAIKIFAEEDLVPFCFVDLQNHDGDTRVVQLDARSFMESEQGKERLGQVLRGIARPNEKVNVLRISMVMEVRATVIPEGHDIDSMYRQHGDSLADWPAELVRDIIMVTTETRARHISLMAEVDCKARKVTVAPHCVTDSTQEELTAGFQSRFAHLFDPPE